MNEYSLAKVQCNKIKEPTTRRTRAGGRSYFCPPHFRAKIRNISDVRKFMNIFLCFLLIQQNFRAANAMNACFFILLPKGEKCGVAMLSRESRWSSKSHHACMFGRVEKKTVRLIASRTDFVHDQMLLN